MTSDRESLLELLYRAFNAPHGIIISTDDPVRTKQQLYRERQKDPALACLSFLTSPFNPQGEIIILKKEIPDEGGQD